MLYAIDYSVVNKSNLTAFSCAKKIKKESALSTIVMSTNHSLGLMLNTTAEPEDGVSPDDATWILTSAFIIFTMQSGFGLVESGN